MTAANYPSCYKRIQAHEGGNDDDPIDPGGRTSRGVIQREYDSYRDRKSLPRRDVWTAADSEIAEIMKSGYWDKLDCDDLPSGVDYSVDDYSINSGYGRAGKVLRRILGLNADDWRVTDEVLAEIKKRRASDIVVAINDERLRFLQSLKTWPHFGGGWGRRVSEVRAFSIQLAGGAVQIPMPKLPAPGKGAHPKPNTGSVIAGGGAAAAGSGGLAHWIGAHPTISFGLALIIIGIVAFLLQYLKNQHQAKQETPMPDTPIVPVAPPAPSPAAVNDAARATMVQNATKP